MNSKFQSLHTNVKDTHLYKKVNTKAVSYRPVFEVAPNKTVSIDLVDMSKSPSGGYHYIMNCVDIFSRKAWAFLMKTKNKIDLLDAVDELLARTSPTKIWADQEPALKSNELKIYLKAKGVTLYHTFGTSKAAMVERFNRTMKEQMAKQFSTGDGNKMKEGWHEFVPKFVDLYNKTTHSSLGATPNNTHTEKDLQDDVRSKMFARIGETPNVNKGKFKEGDQVLIFRTKGAHEKGYTKNFTNEIFVVHQVLDTTPETYKVRDGNGEVILGSFYPHELLKAK